jgi:hypothetical protein
MQPSTRIKASKLQFMVLAEKQWATAPLMIAYRMMGVSRHLACIFERMVCACERESRDSHGTRGATTQRTGRHPSVAAKSRGKRTSI